MKRGSKRKTYKRKTYKRKTYKKKTYKKSYKRKRLMKSNVKEINKKRKSKKRKSKKRKLIGGSNEEKAKYLCGGSPPGWGISGYKNPDECISDVKTKLGLRAEAEEKRLASEAEAKRIAAEQSMPTTEKTLIAEIMEKVRKKRPLTAEETKLYLDSIVGPTRNWAELKEVDFLSPVADTAKIEATEKAAGVEAVAGQGPTEEVAVTAGDSGINQYQGPNEMFPDIPVKHPYMASMADAGAQLLAAERAAAKSPRAQAWTARLAAEAQAKRLAEEEAARLKKIAADNPGGIAGYRGQRWTTNADVDNPNTVFYLVYLRGKYFLVRYSDVKKAHTKLLASKVYKEAIKKGWIISGMPKMPKAHSLTPKSVGLTKKQKDNRAKGIQTWFDQLIVIYDWVLTKLTPVDAEICTEAFALALDNISFCSLDGGCNNKERNPLRPAL